MDIADAFRIAPGKRVNLAKRDPADSSLFPDKKAAKAQLGKDAARINELQDKLYAEGRRALLVILQGTDTSGKDGTIRHVFNETGPLRSVPGARRWARSLRTRRGGEGRLLRLEADDGRARRRYSRPRERLNTRPGQPCGGGPSELPRPSMAAPNASEPPWLDTPSVRQLSP
jgi:hypothetical protein